MIQQPDFDGDTYDHERDRDRMGRQLRDVRRLMADRAWRTLVEITILTGHQPQSVSARLRDLRKAKFGGLNVERRYVERGLWEYRIAPDEEH